MSFADFETEIYLAGVRGVVPDLPISVAALEEAAREAMTPEARDYVAGGAGAEDTMRANREAFRAWRIVPRHLVGIGTRDIATDVLGTPLPAPVMLAPIGVQGIVHPDAEVAVARAASSVGVPFVLSTLSSRSMEEVAEAAGDGPRWFQLYWPRADELTKSFLSRAEAAGYRAVVVTLDTQMFAWRPRDLRRAFLPFLRGEGMANFFTDPVFRGWLDRPPEEDVTAAAARWAGEAVDADATWEDLARLRELTTLPMLAKGLLHRDDARRAVDAGMDGVVVSNHGGRQVDGAVGALEALPEVVAAVGDRVPVLFDSGIRTGADAVKALALGARAVLLGRPYLWGLAVAGEAGVRHALRCFLAELELTLALAGAPRLADLDPSLLVRV